MTLGVIIGYDGSHAATSAIDVVARLFPQARATVVHLWTPPFASEGLRRRLRATADNASDLGELTEREGEREAQRIAAAGATLAGAAGLTAEPVVKRSWGGGGDALATLSKEVSADLVAVGTRGLGGTHALLGSVSEAAVQHACRPTLVVPWPLLSGEFDALQTGPVVIGWDSSPGADKALDTARQVFADRQLLITVVDGDAEGDPPTGERLSTIHAQRSGSSAKATAAAIVAAAAERDAGAVVVGSRGRSAARKMLMGSVASATVHSAHRPVLVVPPGT